MNVTALQKFRSSLPVRIAAVALGYALFSILGLFLLDVPMELVELWPAAGLATAVLLGGGRQLWPGIPLGFLIVHTVDSAIRLDPTLPAPLLAPPLVGAAAATVQAYLAVTLIERRFGRDPVRLDAARDWVELAVYTGPLSCAAAAALGGLGLYLGDVVTEAPLSSVVLEWWIGDMLGVLLVLPLFLTWPTTRWRRLRWNGHPLPSLSQLAALAATVGLILTLSLSHAINTTDVAKNRKLFAGAVNRGGSHLLHEYVSLKAVLNAAALDIGHEPENPMNGMSHMRNPDPIYLLGGMDGFGLIRPTRPAAVLPVTFPGGGKGAETVGAAFRADAGRRGPARADAASGQGGRGRRQDGL
ncbi:MASE1 domain-containing protein [Acidimangrovimonas pyrenivorans]|uniref:MASE1 domain-containing protein n=1 Tax=Acidimangrovimonas pyrenivorans TaxID=2030798 RepID=A0ABV7AG17_9RHOB